MSHCMLFIILQSLPISSNEAYALTETVSVSTNEAYTTKEGVLR